MPRTARRTFTDSWSGTDRRRRASTPSTCFGGGQDVRGAEGAEFDLSRHGPRNVREFERMCMLYQDPSASRNFTS